MDRKLKNYLPPVFKQFREFLATIEGEQPQVERLYESTAEALEQQFLHSAGDYGLSRWETSLGIIPKASESLEERRFRLLAHMGSQLPYTHRKLEARLEQLCGTGKYSVDINCTECTIKVYVALSAESSYRVVADLLKKMIPANMEVMLSLKYNQHMQFIGMTHSEMAAYTYGAIRNEVFS